MTEEDQTFKPMSADEIKKLGGIERVRRIQAEEAAKDALRQIYDDFIASNGLDKEIGEKVERDARFLMEDESAIQDLTEKILNTWTDHPDSESLQVIFVADEDGTINFKFIGDSRFGDGASAEEYPYRSVAYLKSFDDPLNPQH